MSYKNVYLEKGEDYFNWKVHLWQDSGYSVEKFKNFAFKECNPEHATHTGVNGEPMRRIEKWWHEDKGIHYSDHNRGNMHIKYLCEKYGTSDEVSKTHRELYYDIEIELGGDLTPEFIKKAPKKITSIALWDAQLDDWKCCILDPKGEVKHTIEGNKEIIPFKREQDLLSWFIDYWKSVEPDIVVGYNSDFFDNPYTYYRIKNVLTPRHAKSLSPINIVEERDWMPDAPIKFAGIASLDYYRLHEKYSMRDEPSMKLDDLGKKYVNLGKVEYEGSLDRLFETNIKKYIDYNFRDVEILKELDKHFQYLAITKNLAHKGNILYDEVYLSSRIHDGSISSYLLNQNIVPPNKDPEATQKHGYAGGFLFCPQTGIFKYVFDEDLTSLYPSIIMSLNIGRDTYVARILDRDDRNNRLGLNDLKAKNPDNLITIESNKGSVKEIKISELIRFIEETKLTISANGVMFRTDKPSTLSTVLNNWFNERVEFKKKMKEAYKSGDKELGDYYHLRQYTLKILLNSLYGATSRPEFRYAVSNALLAEAITLTGWRIIQDSAKYVNKKINKLIKNK